MGSLIAAATAAKYPHLLGPKLILLAPISVRPNRFFAALQPLVTVLPNRLIGYITTKFLFVPRHNRSLFQEALRTTYACSAHYLSRSAVAQAAHFSTQHSISDFPSPQTTYLIAGATDRLIPATKTRQLAAQLHAHLHFVPNTGHLLNYEDPAATARAIRSALTD